MKYIKRFGIVSIWLLLWQLVSVVVNNALILAGPIDIADVLVNDVVDPDFWTSIGFSLLRITLGFLAAFILGVSIGIVAGHVRAVMEFLEPAIQFMKSVPVVCFIVILLIWFGSSFVSIIAVFLVAFPAVYASVIEALVARDPKMLTMLKLFRVSAWRRTLAFSWPAFLPFLLSACRVAVGMSWKAGIAAELIGLPLNSIGESIYQAKLTFSSAELFSWTIVVVVISLVCEKVFLLLLRNSERWVWYVALPGTSQRASSNNTGATQIQPFSPATDGELAQCCSMDRPSTCARLKDVTVSFDDEVIINALTLELLPGKCYALRGVSGSGKTTVLSVIEGLVTPTAGTVEVDGAVSAVFQDTRLFEGHNAIENVQLFVGQCVSREQIGATLKEVLPPDSLHKPVQELSGGMRRRVELVRALLLPSQLLLLDEPFAGLDDASKAQAQQLVIRERKGRTLVVATHDLHDERALGLESLQLSR